MQPRDWLLRIEDMLDAAEAIRSFTRDVTFETFSRDRKTVDAVVRNLEVMGEAARHVPESIRQRFSDVPWTEIVGMRSVLVHGYFGVDLDILWTTIQDDLPGLTSQLKKIREGF